MVSRGFSGAQVFSSYGTDSQGQLANNHVGALPDPEIDFQSTTATLSVPDHPDAQFAVMREDQAEKGYQLLEGPNPELEYDWVAEGKKILVWAWEDGQNGFKCSANVEFVFPAGGA